MDFETLASAYAAARLAEAIADPQSVKRSESRTPEEIDSACSAYLDRERKIAMKLLAFADTRNFAGLSNSLHVSNPNWRKLFRDFAQVDSLPRTQSALREFLRNWIGPTEVDRQTAELERIHAEKESERLAKLAERNRAECLKNAYRFCFSESGGIVETTTFGRILDYVATLTRRAAQIVNLTPGLPPDMSRAIRAYPPINGRCQCRRVFWADGWRDSGDPPFSADGARLATIRK